MREPNGRRVREGGLTHDQDVFGAKIMFNDGEYAVVRSLSDAVAVLQGVSIKRQFDMPKPTHGKIT